MWRIAGSVVLILGGLLCMYYISSALAKGPREAIRLAIIIPAVAPGLIPFVVGVGRLIWK